MTTQIKTQDDLQIQWSLQRKIERLKAQAQLQKDLGNLGRADILVMRIEKLKEKIK